MLNIIKLKEVSKDDVIKKFTDVVNSMNTHQFEKLKKTLNKSGVLDDVCK